MNRGALLMLALLLSGCAPHRAAALDPKTLPLTHLPQDPIVVFGGTPQGVAAAVAAAKMGVPTLLLARHRTLGGVLTRGWLATLDMSYDRINGMLLTQGLFLDFFNRIGDQISFSVPQAIQAFNEMVANAGVSLIRGVRLLKVKVDHHRITALFLANRFDPQAPPVWLPVRYVIDASRNAELAAMAGVPYTIGRQDTGLDRSMMAASLVFRITGVPWHPLAVYVRERAHRTHDGSGVNETSIWGLSHLVANFKPSSPFFKLRGLNLALQPDGSILVNGLLIFGVNGDSARSRKEAWEAGAQEARRVVAYLRQASPLFAHAHFAGVAKSLYIRETRHILGLYRLSPTEVLYGAKFWDRVVLGSYPLDGQAYHPNEPALLMGVPATYSIPFRSIVPQRIDNLLVASQAASFDAIAAFSARTVPVQMDLGQAAGVAAALAVQRGVSFPEMAASRSLIHELQNDLIAQGALLDAPGLGRPVNQQEPGFHAAQVLFDHGLFMVPYGIQGSFGLRDPMIWPMFVANLLRYQLAVDPKAPALQFLQTEWNLHRAWAPVTVAQANQFFTTYARLLHLRPLPPPDGLSPESHAILTRGQAAQWTLEALEEIDAHWLDPHHVKDRLALDSRS